jgi:D-alanyl-D-alanine carboxypeptidase
MRKEWIILIIVLIILFFACDPPASTDNGASTIQERLQAALEEVFREYPGMALSAAVVFADRTVWLGTVTAENSTRISSGDLFWIGSITKMYTATVVLQLIEEGRLRLDDRIKQFLPSSPISTAASPSTSCCSTPPGCTK